MGTTEPDDLALRARLALVDLLYELRRQELGVRPVGVIPDPFKIPEQADSGMKTSPNARSPFAGTRPTKINQQKGEAPAIAYVRSLGMDVLVSSQVAETLNVSTQAIRKWAKDPKFKAPSMEVPFGTNIIHLYTPEDVEELREYVWSTRTPKARN